MLIVRLNRADVENDTWTTFEAQYPQLAADLQSRQQ
jgi:hypothetical protein